MPGEGPNAPRTTSAKAARSKEAWGVVPPILQAARREGAAGLSLHAQPLGYAPRLEHTSEGARPQPHVSPARSARSPPPPQQPGTPSTCAR